MNYLANLFFQTVKDYTMIPRETSTQNYPDKPGDSRGLSAEEGRCDSDHQGDCGLVKAEASFFKTILGIFLGNDLL